MGARLTVRKQALWTLGLVALALLLSACSSEATQDTLQPVGEVAKQQKALFETTYGERSADVQRISDKPDTRAAYGDVDLDIDCKGVDSRKGTGPEHRHHAH